MAYDYFPRKEAEFYGWVSVFFTYMAANIARFGISSSLLFPLISLRDDFFAKFTVAITVSTRTKSTVLDKNIALNVLKDALRVFIREYLTYNHLVTNSDRENLGLPVRKTVRTPVSVPTIYPSCTVDTSIIRVLVVNFFDSVTKKRAKPPGVHGAEIKYKISDTPIVNPDDMVHSAFDTRSPFRLVFRGEDRGKTVWLCLRWQNTRGGKGPWAEVVSAVIP
jgi:hypothetical protein